VYNKVWLQLFEGTQTSSSSRAPPGEPPDVWAVSVRVHEIDLKRGRCSGDMTARDVPPKAKCSIATHWEGAPPPPLSKCGPIRFR